MNERESEAQANSHQTVAELNYSPTPPGPSAPPPPPPPVPRYTVQWGGHRGWQRACTDWSCRPKSWLCDKPSGTGGGGRRCCGRAPPPPRARAQAGANGAHGGTPLPEGTSSPPAKEAVAMSRTPGRTFCGCKAGPRGAGGGVQETACGAGAGGGDESGRRGGGGGLCGRRGLKERATDEVIPPPPSPPQGGSVPLVGEGGGQPPVNTVDVPVEGLAPPPPPHALRWTPWPPHNALTRVTGTSSEICRSSGSQSDTHTQAPPYRCRPPCFWAVMRPCVCGAGAGGYRSDVGGRVGRPLKQLYRPPHLCGGGGGGCGITRIYSDVLLRYPFCIVIGWGRLGGGGGQGGGGRHSNAPLFHTYRCLPTTGHSLQTIDHGLFTADQCLQTTHQMPPRLKYYLCEPPPPPHTHVLPLLCTTSVTPLPPWGSVGYVARGPLAPPTTVHQTPGLHANPPPPQCLPTVSAGPFQ